MLTALWVVGALVLFLAVLYRVGPRLGKRFREYRREPGRLAVRNDARFFRATDNDPRYIRREDDGRE